MIRHLNNTTGVTLLLVLWVLVMLTVISGEFCRAMRTEVNITRNFKETTQAYYSAVGGFNLALARILDTIASPGASGVEKETETEAIDWRINAEIPPVPVGDGLVRVRIDNEGGKVNINLANDTLLRIMVAGLDLTVDEQAIVVNSILDWRDADNLHRINGAENEYYQSLPDPYACKNGDFDTIEELLRVRGITSELFHNGLDRMVTIYPDRQTATQTMDWRPGQQAPKGTFDFNKININAAAPELLIALPGFSPESVEAIIAHRLEKEIRSGGELLTVVGTTAYTASMNIITFERSPFYRITAWARGNDSGARQGVAGLVYVDVTSADKYKIFQWIDRLDPTHMKSQLVVDAAGIPG